MEQVLAFSALFPWGWCGIKLSQLQILFTSLLTDKSENNLILRTPIPHWILGLDVLDWFARFVEKTPT